MAQDTNGQQRPPILLYTDGASSGNPGPGGYGVVLKCGGYSKEMSGGYNLTTNNRMELLAVITGLEAINEGWLENWQRRGYARVKNPDLWMRLSPLLRKHRVAFHWIKGHAGHPENERCDALAVAAGAGAVAAGRQLPQDPGYSPE